MPPDTDSILISETSTGAKTAGRRPSTKGRNRLHHWARWLHVYTSMIALLIVLFFGATGITLNHPSWTFGDQGSETTESGTLPFPATSADGTVEWLPISEYMRSTHGVNGSVDNFATTGEGAAQTGTIVYKNAGYSADLVFDVATGDYEIVIAEEGLVAVMNDLHKGRDTGDTWRWVIDVSAGFLVVISLTGLVMQFFLRKRRRSALTVAVLGGAIAVALMLVTLG